MNFLANKTENFRAIKKYLEIYPIKDRFFAETYLLPEEYEDYYCAHKVVPIMNPGK